MISCDIDVVTGPSLQHRGKDTPAMDDQPRHKTPAQPPAQATENPASTMAPEAAICEINGLTLRNGAANAA